jgi:hypothetical protein
MASGGAGAAASSSSSTAFGHALGLEVVEIYNPEELNFILGHGGGVGVGRGAPPGGGGAFRQES